MNHLKFDLHIHSEYSSDSFVPIKKILKFSKKIGLSGIAITDHNTIKGGLEAKKLNKSDLVIIIGSEITLNNGGELLGLFLQREIKRGSFFEVYDQIKEQDGLIVLPHPFRHLKKNIDKLTKNELSHIKIIEGINAFNSPSENNQAIQYAEKNSLTIIGGSDSHHYSTIGAAYTVFSDIDDLKKQILEGKISYGGKSINKKERTRIFINRNLKSKNYKQIIRYNYEKILERLR